jgi:Na+-transporting NADH:ubiquinone oxidoreductase subunit F
VATVDVSIVVNEDTSKALKVPAGGTLLGALTANRIFLPAACGGKGACGVCEVVVKEGGGALMPTETGFISPREARHGMRLACQVKVKRDMRIEVAPEIFSVRKWQCKVIHNRNVSTFIKELKLALPEGVDVPFRAGGYVQIECPPHELSYRDFDIDPEFREEWDKFDLWRFKSVVTERVERAYSMANFPLEKGILLFTIRVVFPPDYREDIPPGKMSSWLFALKPGDEVTVSGPYGEFFARETHNEMCFVAAGAGMAPMRSHIFDQLYRLKTQRKMTFWYSARNLSEAFYVEEFEKLQAENPNFEWHLVLSEPRPEDHWTGPVGLVRQKVLRTHYLDQHPAPEDIEFYLCGPDVMNKAVIRMAMDLGVERENIMLDDFG